MKILHHLLCSSFAKGATEKCPPPPPPPSSSSVSRRPSPPPRPPLLSQSLIVNNTKCLSNLIKSITRVTKNKSKITKSTIKRTHFITFPSVNIKCVSILLVWMLLVQTVAGCGPGRGGGRRRSPRKLTALVFKQHVPNVSENTLGASGLNEGKITREDPRFKELVPNYNPDIIFKDEEGTGADRLMTQRLKEKLNTLAISVMNQWPGVKLRVTEGWDEEGHHAADSLHYEGRAVDITTSDRDRSKYGMLARLAVEAGFDWVYYESRFHIHVSVKSEKSDPGKAGGCFHRSSLVQTVTGLKKMDQLRIGDEVLTGDTSSGQVKYSRVLLFMDYDRSPVSRLYYHLLTERGKRIILTGSHLIFVRTTNLTTNPFQGEGEDERQVEDSHAVFAKHVQVGHYLYTFDGKGGLSQSSRTTTTTGGQGSTTFDTLTLNHDEKAGRIVLDRVVHVETHQEEGAFAPLTEEGTILVDDVLASCYAILDNQLVAHLSFAPIRLLNNLRLILNYLSAYMNSWLSLVSADPKCYANQKAYHSISDSISYNNQSSIRCSISNSPSITEIVSNSDRSDDNHLTMPDGVHWYPRLLYNLVHCCFPNSLLSLINSKIVN